MTKLVFTASLCLVMGSAAAAQPAPPTPVAPAPVQTSEAFRTRAAQVVELLNGQRAPQDFFFQGFEQRLPVAQLNRVLAQVRRRYGAAVGVSAIESSSPNAGIITVDMENGQLRLRLEVSEVSPHPVDTLLLAR